MKTIISAILCLGGLVGQAPMPAAAQEQPAPVAAAFSSFSGTKTPTGLRIQYRGPDTAFSLDLAGKVIRPTGRDRLAWDIDGKAIELAVASYPPGTAAAGAGDRLDRYARTPGAGGAGWTIQGAAERLPCPGGRTCVAWLSAGTAAPASVRLAVATLVDDTLVVLSDTGGAAAQVQAQKAYLTSALATINKVAVPKQAGRQPGPDDANFEGLSLEQTMQVAADITGEPMAALVNEQLATAKDAALPNALALQPAALLETTRFLLASKVDTLFGAQLLDGRSSHDINLTGALLDSDTIQYWDPWGKGSFLTLANNQAGVNAVPDPTQERQWLVKGAELQRVLYGIMLPERELVDVLRLFAVLDGSPEALPLAIAAMQADPKTPFKTEASLRQLAHYLLQRNAADPAIKLSQAIATLYPDSPGAKQDLAAAYAAAHRAPAASTQAAAAEAETGPSTLAALKTTDFFTFFHLQQERAEPDAKTGGQRVVFKPSGGKFHDLVTLVIGVDADGAVLRRTLALDRSFIEDRNQGIFARDIAKSDIADAVADDERGQIADLLAEIFRQASATVPIPAALQTGAAVPRLPSQAYAVFLGSAPSVVQQLKRHTLTLKNGTLDGKPSLVIIVDKR